MRRSLILGLLVLAGAVHAETPNLSFGDNLWRFHVHYCKFMLAYLGCARDVVSVDQCKPKLATFDWGEFNRAAREARVVFGLGK